MRHKAPDNPMQSTPMPKQENPNGFQNFTANTQFLQHIHKHGHLPLWIEPKLAHQLLIQHGHSGAVVPHPSIDVNDLSK